VQEHDHALALLSGLAVALGHGVQLDFLLADLATGVRRILDADRVSVLLLDDADRLTPAVAVARQQDDNLWQTFRRMPPIALDDLVGARQALSAGDVLVIDDATSSPLVPAAWQRAFRLGSLAIAPLTIDRIAAGIVVVDHVEAGTTFSPTQLALLEGMAALAGIALDGVRRGSHAERANAVSHALQELAAAHSQRAVAEHTLAALLEVAQVSHGLIALFGDDDVDVVAVRGSGLPEPGAYSMGDVPSSIRDACLNAWNRPARVDLVSVTYDDNQPLLVVPIRAQRRVIGAALLPVSLSATSRDVIAEIEVIATGCGLALRARRNAEDREWFVQAMSIAESATDAALDAGQLVDDVRELLGAVATPVINVVGERTVARTLGLPPAPAAIARRLTRWQRAGGQDPVVVGAELAWPLTSGGRVLGALVTPADVSSRARDRVRIGVAALAAGLGRVADEAQIRDLHRAAAEAEGHRAVAVRAYREATQVLSLLTDQLRAGSLAEPRVTAAARVLVDQAKRLVRDAAGAMSSDDVKQAGLRTALTAMAEQIYALGGPGVVVRQRGRVGQLDPGVQVALVRATRRLLTLLRDQRAATVSVHIETDSQVVVVRLRPGQTLNALEADELGAHSALNEARGWLEPLGGTAHLDHEGGNRLFVMTAPTDSRRPERSTPPVHRRDDSGEVLQLKR
jgi:GAF domain-containing protein